MIKEINVTTGEEFVREFSAQEIAELEAAANNAAVKKAEAAAKEAARQALLDKLGITADEAKLLLGSN
jgi:hypothetical protein